MNDELKALIAIMGGVFLFFLVESILSKFAGKCPACKSRNTRKKMEYGVTWHCLCGATGQQHTTWRECKKCTHIWDEVIHGEDIRKSGHCQPPMSRQHLWGWMEPRLACDLRCGPFLLPHLSIFNELDWYYFYATLLMKKGMLWRMLWRRHDQNFNGSLLGARTLTLLDGPRGTRISGGWRCKNTVSHQWTDSFHIPLKSRLQQRCGLFY